MHSNCSDQKGSVRISVGDLGIPISTKNQRSFREGRRWRDDTYQVWSVVRISICVVVE